MRVHRSAAVLGAFAGAAMAVAPAAGQYQPTLLQLFEMEWDDVERRTPDIFLAGFDGIWLPPPSRANDAFSVGFDVFDRFDLGSPPLLTTNSNRARTAYGTEGTLRSMVEALKQAGVEVYFDAVLNHNSPRTNSDAFIADGGWPGFFLPRSFDANGNPRDKVTSDDWGDFHNGAQDAISGNALIGDLLGLIDINQFEQRDLFRQPVEFDDPRNLPLGNFRNRPDPENARFYPDRDLAPFVFTNPADGVTRTRYPFNLGNPAAGDPVPESVSEYLARWSRWMVEVIGASGLRLDASRHTFIEFWSGDFDAAMHQSVVLPDGRRVNGFTFGENSNNGPGFIRDDAFADRDLLDLDGARALRGIVEAGCFGNWADALSATVDFQDDFFQNGSAGVLHIFSHDDGSIGNGSSRPPLPTEREQGFAPHAYLLMRPGVPLIYHNGRGVLRSFGFFPREGNPTALGLNPATQTPDDRLATLVRLRREYGDGEFFQLVGDISDVLVFEKSRVVPGSGRLADVLVGVNDRFDAGFDTRNVITQFPEGTRLLELTGNAADPRIDPGDDIPEVITVGSNGAVTIRVPRNVSSEGEHNGGYVVYGPPVPGGELTIEGAGGVISPDPAFFPDFAQRVAEIPVVSQDTFTIRLDTFARDPFDNVADDNAVFRINRGFGDFNGSGGSDFPRNGSAVDGFERFLDVSEPGQQSPSRTGVYAQSIDAAALGDGFHYITVRAFRPRPSGATPLFSEFREVVYVDREPAEFTIDLAGQTIDDDRPELRVLAEDSTVEDVHVFLNLPAGTDPASLIGPATEARVWDAREWRDTVESPLQPGENIVSVVGVEPSGRAVAREFALFLGSEPCSPADIAQTNGQFGALDGSDIAAFVQGFLGGRFDVADIAPPSAGDGFINGADISAFIQAFLAGCP